ncbi:winged helix DNA-binding domain-containing protein [Kribbella sp. NBC_01510]|uniref:winged helix DNA-binding domain-containing protein n=1 Tax=Kribbella sp. NBC_01510 TaxID=2903581 RepID=UPI003865F462
MTKLSLQALNRATLHRQWLIERQDATALDAIEHLVGLQAQSPLAPYVGLWTRLNGFQPAELVTLLEERQAVRGSMMRATIHLMSSRDFLAFRPLIQPRLEREVFQNITYGRHRLEGLDMDAVLRAGIDRMTEGPATAVQLREHLAPLWPDREPAALAHAVRCLLPTIQTPPRGIWGKGGNPAMSTAELWLDSPVDPSPVVDDLVLRYLAAYGPASVADAQTWSGLTHLSEVFDRLDLRQYTDASSGRPLYDLPHITLPDESLEVPTRFLPEYDNLLLSHADRTRWIDTATRQRLTLQEVLTKGSLLHNGQAKALWKLTKPTKTKSVLEIAPFTNLPRKTWQSIESEAHNLLTFTTPTATHEITRIDT